MKTQNYMVKRYDADDGMVFDWKEPHYDVDEEGNQIQEHLHAKTLFIGEFDSIDNYIEVIQPIESEDDNNASA